MEPCVWFVRYGVETADGDADALERKGAGLEMTWRMRPWIWVRMSELEGEYGMTKEDI
jgi:hypothetical protein